MERVGASQLFLKNMLKYRLERDPPDTIPVQSGTPDAGNVFLLHRKMYTLDDIQRSEFQSTSELSLGTPDAFQVDMSTVVTCHRDDRVRIWKKRDMGWIEESHIRVDDPMCIIVFRSNTIVVGCGDGMIRFFSLETGIPDGVVHGHNGLITTLCLSDYDTFASGGVDGSVKRWHITEQGNLYYRIIGVHNDFITCVTSAGDDKVLCASADRTVVIWDMNTNTKICEPLVHDQVIMCAVLIDDRILTRDSQDDKINTWIISE